MPVRFRQHGEPDILGKLLVIGGGAPIHRGQPIKAFLTQGAAKRLRLKELPGQAPDLHLKYVELRNVGCTDLREFQRYVYLAAGLYHKRHFRNFVSHAGNAIWTSFDRMVLNAVVQPT